MDDIDIWRAAQLLIKQHDDPELFAAGHIDQIIARGDVAGEAAWKRILSAIRELQRQAPPKGRAIDDASTPHSCRRGASPKRCRPSCARAVNPPRHVTDGDTLRIGRERIRLFGIDAPEMNQSCNNDRGARYSCGEVARDLRRHVGNALVSCQPSNRDGCGRIVARCSALGADLSYND